MKVCNAKAMKIIKELEAQKELLTEGENENSQISFREGEEKISNGYSYSSTRAQIAEIDNKVRKIRVTLAKSNCSTKLDTFDMTIGEALVMLAQLQNEKEQLDCLAEKKQLSRRITANGVIEYTECLFDVNAVKGDVDKLRTKISDLQIAIDRANLTNYVEI